MRGSARCTASPVSSSPAPWQYRWRISPSGGFYFGGYLLAAMAPVARAVGSEPWRLTMLAVGITGLPLSLGATLTIDPPRLSLAAQEKASAGLGDFIVTRFHPVLLFVGAAGGLAIAVQAVMPMAAMALQRRYETDLGAIGHALGNATLVTSLASLVIAGIGDRLLMAWLGHRSRPAIMCAATLIALPCMWSLAGASTEPAAVALLTGFLLATCIANALIPTMLQDIVPADLRARAFAAYSFLIAAFCAIGPVLSGSISDRLRAGDLLSAIAVVSVPALGATLVCAGITALRAISTAA